jgi:hypothetical protein
VGQVPVAHTPFVLATQEAEIRKIMVWGQPRQRVHKTLSWKYPPQKRAGGVAQMVQHLPSKRETLSSNPGITRKKKKRQEWISNAVQELLPSFPNYFWLSKE